MARMNLDLDDLTNAALKRMVKQLLTASDEEQDAILSRMTGKKQKKEPKNDLADLHEEMHGKPNTPMVEDDDLVESDDASDEEDDDAEEMPVKRGKK